VVLEDCDVDCSEFETLTFIGGDEKEQYERPIRRAVVDCMRKCRTLHHGVVRAIQESSGVFGRIDMREHAACRQFVAISARSLVSADGCEVCEFADFGLELGDVLGNWVRHGLQRVICAE
jgi:hypothetical protein